LGRWGELEQVLNRALDVAGKNGNLPWLGIFRATKAWLLLQVRDLDGARRLAEELLVQHTEEPAGQVRTSSLLTLAFVDLESGHVDQSLQAFTKISERPSLPRFFLDWHSKLLGQIGLAMARLAKGDLAGANQTADTLVKAASSSASAALKAVAWDVKAKIAMAANDWEVARQSIERSLSILSRTDCPCAAWKIHETASACHQHFGNSEVAGPHHVESQDAVMVMVRSFPVGHPLRNSLLAGEPFRRILGDEASNRYLHAE